MLDRAGDGGCSITPKYGDWVVLISGYGSGEGGMYARGLPNEVRVGSTELSVHASNYRLASKWEDSRRTNMMIRTV